MEQQTVETTLSNEGAPSQVQNNKEGQNKLESQKDLWCWLYGPENKPGLQPYSENRKKINKAYRRLSSVFGSEVKMRQFLYFLAHRLESGEPFPDHFLFSEGLLDDITPDAIRFIARYGIFQRVLRWRSVSTEPAIRKCYLNARVLMLASNRNRKRRLATKKEIVERRKKPMLYVEGITFGVGHKPMLHAWNSFKKKEGLALDWTFYAFSPWGFYFGIPFDDFEYRKIERVIDPTGKTRVSIFRKNRFTPAVRQYVLWLMRQRKYVRRQMFGRKQFKKKRGKKNQ